MRPRLAIVLGALLVAVVAMVAFDAPDEALLRDRSPAPRDEAGPTLRGTGGGPGAQRVEQAVVATLRRALHEFPKLQVLVETGRGEPVPGAVVYALPSGAPGADDLDELPHGRTDSNGVLTMHVARAEEFDIAAVAEHGEAPLQTVRVDSEGPTQVRLKLVERVPCSIDFRDGAPPGTYVVISSEDAAGRVLTWPGRNETRSERVNVVAPGGAGSKSVLLQPERRYRVHAGYVDAFLQASPEVVTAPQGVAISRPPTFGLRITPRIRSRHGVLDAPCLLSLRLWHEPDPTDVRELDVVLPAGQSPQGTTLTRTRFLVAEPTATVCWSGPGFRAGRKEFEGLEAYAFREVIVEPELDVLQAVPAARAQSRVRRFRASETHDGGLRDDDEMFLVIGRRSTGTYSYTWSDFLAGGVREVATDGSAYRVISSSGFAASPTAVLGVEPEAHAGVVPTGVVRISPLPEDLRGLGALRLRDAAGTPLCVRVAEGWALEASVRIDQTCDLGGLEPGLREVEVHVGGALLGRLSFEVQAGEVHAVTIAQGR